MGPKKHPQQTAEDQAIDAAARRRRQCRLAQARYRHTPKGVAARMRYEGGPKRQRLNATHNPRRIYVGSAYRGKAVTDAQAAIIRQHVKERLRAFTRQQTGA